MAGRGRDAHVPPDILFVAITNSSGEINWRLTLMSLTRNKKNLLISTTATYWHLVIYLELLIHSAFLESHVRAHLCNDW